MFNKGDRVKLNERGLNFIYPHRSSQVWRDLAAKKIFVVIGHSLDKRETRVMIEGGTVKSSLSYHNGFLQRVLSKGEIITIYEDPVTRMKPEGKAELVRLIEPSGDLERWWVQFLGDDFKLVERLIRVTEQ